MSRDYENSLSVFGEPKDVRQFFQSCMGIPAHYPDLDSTSEEVDTPCFCFHALVPTPASILQNGFGAEFDYYNSRGHVPEDLEESKLTGWQWNMRHWGTSFDIDNHNITMEEVCWGKDGKSGMIHFFTSDAPPSEWFYCVSERHPSLSFTLHYENERSYNAGDLFSTNGHCNSVKYNLYDCAEFFQRSEHTLPFDTLEGCFSCQQANFPACLKRILRESVGELSVVLTETTLTVSEVGYPTNTFQLVNEYPLGYMIWNIGSHMPRGYLPFCRLASHQPSEGSRNIEADTLKALKVEGAELVLAAIGHGEDTVEAMEAFLSRHEQAEPGTWYYAQSKRIQAALPILKRIGAK